MRYRLEYALLRCIGFVLARMSVRGLWILAGIAAKILVAVDLRRIGVAQENLRASFPEWDDDRRTHVAEQSVRHLLQTMFEIPRLASADRDALVRTVRISNIDLVRRLLREHGRLIFLSAHYGNWELGALSCAIQMGTTFTIVGKPQHNPFVDRYLNTMRTRNGNYVVPMQGAVRSMLRSLKEGRSVALLADQSGTPEDVFVPFFGRPASTTPAVAALSLKLDLPIVFGLATRAGDLKYDLNFVEVDRAGLTGLNDDNVRELTARHVSLLETLIRRAPEQWLWMHRRWKHVETR